MKLGEMFAMEIEHEGVVTKRVLDRLPDDKFDWTPHEKSMTLGHLASHLVNLLSWTGITLASDELDFSAMDFEPAEYRSVAECVAGLERELDAATSALRGASDEALMEMWTARAGEKVFFTIPKVTVIRNFVINHGVHHRAQLAMYLRLNDIPVPQIYGPSADEPEM
jgi:uncharacterized damage-inducible protein DinB